MRHPTAPVSIGLSVGLAVGLIVASFVAFPAEPAQSREADRTLKLSFGHTGERGEFTFKRNGRYDRRALDKINQFLRDWRQNEPARMDPQLLDLVWSIYRQSGSRDYIHVVSAYRSPATNEMLRSRTSGVAKNSQHRLGKAMDFFIPDVPLPKLRAIAMKVQGGGVGYYPRSGSPFVHVDTGSVRAWPRMSREQLVAIFPNGNTLHLPADGKPLPGYEQAVAHRKSAGATALAYLEADATEDADTDRTGAGGSSAGWLKRVFPGDGQSDEDIAEETPAPATPAAESPVLLAALEDESANPRLPRARPAGESEAEAEDQPEMLLASADSDAATMFVMPALAFGADAAGFASDIGIRPAKMPLAVPAEDAIAALMAPEESEAATAGKPVQLAYAEDAEEASDPDRAILAAFAAVDRSRAMYQADVALVVAATRRAIGSEITESAAPAALDATIEEIEAGSGIVLVAGDLPGYDGDEDALLDLIDGATAPDPNVAELAMPEPGDASDLYVAPDAASDVADLRGDSGPPVDRFSSPAAATPHNGLGFFTKLFASLIE